MSASGLTELETSAFRQETATHLDQGGLRRFTQSVIKDLQVLQDLLRDQAIESGVHRVGAEQELFLVDADWQPANVADPLLKRLDHPSFTNELGRFNLEINLEPLKLNGDCFRRMEGDLNELIGKVREAADAMDVSVLLTGILPTLAANHLTLKSMSPKPRYVALSEAVNRLRGDDYSIRITGLDELSFEHSNVMLEACNTSFQVHYQVAGDAFSSVYNAAQAVAGPVLAAAVNSPLLFGRRLWAETRIPLFQQSIDTRTPMPPGRHHPSRVIFGTRWVEDSVIDIYREDVARFPALLALPGIDPTDEVGDSPPRLRALSGFNGTVYRWNRPCYGVLGGKPHLRIENRYLPSGPTVVDEVANSALWCGLLRGVAAEYPEIDKIMPFDQATKNFVRGARDGLDAHFDWLDQKSLPARKLINATLLPLARHGLQDLGVAKGEIDRYMTIVEERVTTGRTGAQWALDFMASHGSDPTELAALTESLHRHERTGRSVAHWPASTPNIAASADRAFLVRDLMTPDPFTVTAEQVVDLAVCLMDWRRVRHVPVEDEKHRLIGLVTYRNLLRLFANDKGIGDGSVPIREIMIRDLVTISPDRPLTEALALMEEKEIGCLPVVRGDHLVGILSERDFLPVARNALQGDDRQA